MFVVFGSIVLRCFKQPSALLFFHWQVVDFQFVVFVSCPIAYQGPSLCRYWQMKISSPWGKCHPSLSFQSLLFIEHSLLLQWKLTVRWCSLLQPPSSGFGFKSSYLLLINVSNRWQLYPVPYPSPYACPLPSLNGEHQRKYLILNRITSILLQSSETRSRYGQWHIALVVPTEVVGLHQNLVLKSNKRLLGHQHGDLTGHMKEKIRFVSWKWVQNQDSLYCVITFLCGQWLTLCPQLQQNVRASLFWWTH